MFRIAARNLLTRKFRALSTALAVFFGVAMVAGTLLLTDSVNRAFDNIFGAVNENIDVTVRTADVVEGPFGEAPLNGFEDSLLAQIERVPGVADAEGIIGDPTISILGEDGERIGPEMGPPQIAISDVENPKFEALSIVEGADPGPGEVAIDEDATEGAGFEIGDTIRIAGNAGASDFVLSGITRFGAGDGTGGASLALFTLTDAQILTGKEGRFDEIDVEAERGITPELLAQRVADRVGRGFDVRTGRETADEDAGDIQEALSFLTISLLVFAGIAVFVGGFLIFNTFSITVAQRTREFAMLRTLGASSRQVLATVIAEALVIGVVAALAGIAGGFGFVALIKALFVAGGFDLPVSDLRLSVGSVAIPIVVGVVATVASALVPALRATRVAPLEALRESGGSTEGSGRGSRRRTVVAGVLVVVALGLIGLGLFGDQPTQPALTSMGVGLVLLFVALAMLGGRLVPPIASAIGWPIERARGVTGRLARENSQREPARTATTAAALMIGVALVVFVGVFSASLKASVTDSIDQQFAGDLAVLNVDGFTPISPAVATELGDVEGVGVVSPSASLPVDVRGASDSTLASGLEPGPASELYDLEWVDGSDETLRSLTDDEAILNAAWAEDNGFATGDTLDLTGPAGQRSSVQVAGTVDDPSGIAVFAVGITRDLAREELGGRDDAIVLVGFADNADPMATRGRVDDLLADRFPNTEARDQQQLADDQEDAINVIVTLIYVLLGLSVIVSVFGIVNTLALTILERTRELGMLRAIGTSRSQIKRMIRYESVIQAMLGTVVGAVIGLLLAVAAVEALKDDGLILSVPATLPVVVLVAAVILGVLAALRPARRAAKLDVIEALGYE